MLQRADKPLKGYWCLPGGFIQYDETPKEASEREAREEIGTQVNAGRLVGVYLIENDPRGKNIDIIYSGDYEGHVKLSQEHSKARFFPIDKLPNKIAYKHREAIENWSKKL